MTKKWTDAEVEDLIRQSVQIVADDKERAEYNRLHGKYGAKEEPEETETETDDGKKPPPEKEGKKEENSKRSLWGAYADEDNV